MIIGLYDIDLWHSPKKYPNLELMKIYNYCEINGQKAVMMTPTTDEGRFDKIFYFKDFPSTNPPKNLILSGPKKSIYGYGFYKKFFPLAAKYDGIKPSFIPYDSFSSKLTNSKSYEIMRRSSIVRLENQDFSGWVDDSNRCYIVDQNPAQLEQTLTFLQEHQDIKISFYHGLKMKDEEMYYKFEPLMGKVINDLVVDFKFSPTFFKNSLNSKSFYNIQQREDEDYDTYISRLINMILISKRQGLSFHGSYAAQKTFFGEALSKWMRAKGTPTSFYKFHMNTEYEQCVNSCSAKVRMLLKQNPLTYDSQSIDFW